MPLALIMALLLVLGLGLMQAWTIWFLKREVQRLEFRLGEALDDDDLLEFQERLKSLLSQAKETAADLYEKLDKRKQALDQALERAKEAEKSLALRLLAKSAVVSTKPATPKAAVPAPSKLDPKTKVQARAKTPVKPDLKLDPGKPTATVKTDGFAKAPAKTAPPKAPKDRDRPQTPSSARYQKIYDLSDQGLGLEQIAKQSGVLAGEVQLILNLRRKESPLV